MRCAHGLRRLRRLRLEQGFSSQPPPPRKRPQKGASSWRSGRQSQLSHYILKDSDFSEDCETGAPKSAPLHEQLFRPIAPAHHEWRNIGLTSYGEPSTYSGSLSRKRMTAFRTNCRLEALELCAAGLKKHAHLATSGTLTRLRSA